MVNGYNPQDFSYFHRGGNLVQHFYLDIADFNNDVDTCLKQALAYAVTAAEASTIERIVIISPTNRVSINVAAILIALGCRETNGTFNIIGSSINIVLNSIATSILLSADNSIIR